MFVAINQKGQSINLLEGSVDQGDSYRCPGCQAAVRLKAGRIIRPHFAHVSLADCQSFSENESAQHLSLKAALYQWLKEQEEVAVEQYLPAINQIADLFVNQHLALEVQCSSLSLTAIRKRTAAYHEAGYQVVWLLGEDLWLRDRLTKLQKQFLYFSANMGFYLWELDLKESCLRLRYLIHEDWHGKVQCLTKEFLFGTGSFLSLLRLPYRKQAVQTFLADMDRDLLHYVAQQLYYKVPKWMALQEQAYQQGKNILGQTLADFYPQVRLPQSSQGFAQIRTDLEPIYRQFDGYYARQANKNIQQVYPPAVYCQK